MTTAFISKNATILDNHYCMWLSAAHLHYQHYIASFIKIVAIKDENVLLSEAQN